MGILIALVIMILWLTHLIYSLAFVQVNAFSLYFYLNVFVQAYLYTGLFITGHDAMHGTISKSKNVNTFFGSIASFLFAGMSYARLKKNHYKHHISPTDETDPDFYTKSQNFWIWWFVFMKRYTTISQIIVMAILFNLLKIWFPEKSIWFFWVIPAFLGTLQLFYFGTYLPHKYPHTNGMKPHNARTLKRNHLWAMISCYFFGYHFEHHEHPRVPWWKLYQFK